MKRKIQKQTHAPNNDYWMLIKCKLVSRTYVLRKSRVSNFGPSIVRYPISKDLLVAWHERSMRSKLDALHQKSLKMEVSINGIRSSLSHSQKEFPLTLMFQFSPE